MKVNLITQDKELEDKMLADYTAERIFEFIPNPEKDGEFIRQIDKDRHYPTDSNLFIFRELDLEKLLPFLENFKDTQYTISCGRKMYFNKPEKFKINWTRYLNEQFSRN
ncbi:MAG: hypothetical protein KKA65_03610 [Nanoarchaeota archaeon]|nr:hypothetical protein [Nanoarchaeota archaeon]